MNRSCAFNKRAHRQKRFNNRRNSKLPPSIGANKKLELQVIKLLTKLYPVSHIVVEQIKAKGNKGFSPAMVGQMWQLEQLAQAYKLLGFKVSTKFGWETSQLRQYLGLPKDKQDKSRQVPTTHAVDGITLACTRWMRYGVLSANSMGWIGFANVTPAVFVVIKRPPYSRRQLHLMVPAIGGVRRKYGGSVTRHGFRKGDYVEATQGSRTYRGWVSGDTEKQVSVSDQNWKRLGQFSKNKVRLIRRSTGLIVNNQQYKAVLYGRGFYPSF